MVSTWNGRWGRLIVMGVILVAAAYLRLANLTDNPAWFVDEGSNILVAQRMAEGKIEYMALGQSTLMVSRMVIFEGILAGALAVFGGGIGTLRTITGLCGVISVLAVYLVTHRVTGREIPAIIAAGMLAIYPQAVVMSRFGFSYNLLSPLVMALIWTLWEYSRSGERRWLVGACAIIGFGTISDLWMLAMFAPLAVIVGLRRWRDLWWCLPLAGLPIAIYLGILYLRAPDAAVMDIGFVLLRVSGLTLVEQVWNIGLNFTVLLSGDFWMPCAVIGLILIEGRPLRRVAMAVFFLPLAVIGRTAALHGLSAHYMIPLLPVVAFGAGMLIERGLVFVQTGARGAPQPYVGSTSPREGFSCVYRELHEVIRSKMPWREDLARTAASGLIVTTPLVVSLILGVTYAQGRFPTAIDPFLTDPAEARAVAGFINAHSQPDDLVIVSPAIAWMLRARTADVQMAIAADGTRTVHYPAGIPADRWAYDPHIDGARYVVIDGFWRGWGIANIDGLAAITGRVEGWPVVLESGSIRVYENPAGGGSGP